MAKHDIMVIGASAGGVEAVSRLVGDLPRDLRASILLVVHLARGRSVPPEILTRAGKSRPRILSTAKRFDTAGFMSRLPIGT